MYVKDDIMREDRINELKKIIHIQIERRYKITELYILLNKIYL